MGGWLCQPFIHIADTRSALFKVCVTMLKYHFQNIFVPLCEVLHMLHYIYYFTYLKVWSTGMAVEIFTSWSLTTGYEAQVMTMMASSLQLSHLTNTNTTLDFDQSTTKEALKKH